jgi:hypothetical protein
MGSLFEFNDTLKINHNTFPKELKDGEEYEFNISGKRIFHLFPVRVFLVEEVKGKWNYIGHVHILELNIDALNNTTKGRYKIIKLYDMEYVNLVNKNEPPKGKEFAKD